MCIIFTNYYRYFTSTIITWTTAQLLTLWYSGTNVIEIKPKCSSTMMTSSDGNIFRVTGHLCGEFTGHRWIPRTKASDAALLRFLWSASEQSWGWWFETLSRPLWRHRNDENIDLKMSPVEWRPFCWGLEMSRSKLHYNDAIMSKMASQITGAWIVCFALCSGAEQIKHESSESLAFVRVKPPVTGGFSSQRASNAENVSIWWCHNGRRIIR